MPRSLLAVPLLLPLCLASLPAAAKDITVTPAQVERLAIKLEDVRTTTTEAVALLPATVVPAMNARLAATAPFAGTVVQLHVLPGQMVSKGEALATLSSRELLEAIAQLAQSEAELQMAEAVAQRKRTLASKNIASPTLAEEAEAQVAKIRAVIDRHKTTVALGGISLGENGQYTIRSPAAGKVVETFAMPGGTLAAMAAAVAVDVSGELWLEAQIPAELVWRIKPGDAVQVVDGPVGKVVSVGGSLDKMTRSATMLASVPANSRLLPGQMVTLSVVRPTETGGLEVPAAAVAWIGDEHAVFVRSDNGFTLTPVTLRGKSPLAATISGNLSAGQLVAASGLPQLESMMAGD